MNKRHEQRSRLVADLFHENWSEGSSHAWARHAAASARRRRRLRRSLSLAGASLVLVVLLGLGVRHRAGTASSVATVETRPAYEIISDDELLAEVRDRPLLVLPRKNGTRDFVLLEQ